MKITQRCQAGLVSIIMITFNVPDRPTAEGHLARAVMKHAYTASRPSAWMEENIPEGFTMFDFPKKSWWWLHTTNGLERVSQEIKRKTRVVRIFPNEVLCLRLISAILKRSVRSGRQGWFI